MFHRRLDTDLVIRQSSYTILPILNGTQRKPRELYLRIDEDSAEEQHGVKTGVRLSMSYHLRLNPISDIV